MKSAPDGGDSGFDGHGKTFDDACSDAWEKAKKVKHPGGWFSVTDIEVKTSNPIDGYRVVLRPKGP